VARRRSACIVYICHGVQRCRGGALWRYGRYCCTYSNISSDDGGSALRAVRTELMRSGPSAVTNSSAEDDAVLNVAGAVQITTLQATRSKRADADPNGALAHKRRAGTLADIAEARAPSTPLEAGPALRLVPTSTVACVSTHHLQALVLQRCGGTRRPAPSAAQVACRQPTRLCAVRAEQVLQESGWRGLFNGLQASLLGTAVSQGVYFYFYSVLRQLAIARHQRLTRTASQVPRAPVRSRAASPHHCGPPL